MHKRRKKKKGGGAPKSLDRPRMIITDSCLKERFLSLRGLSAETRAFIFSHSLRSRRLLEIKTGHVMAVCPSTPPHHSQVAAPPFTG